MESPNESKSGNGHATREAPAPIRNPLPPQHEPPLALPAPGHEHDEYARIPKLNDPNVQHRSHWWVWLIVLAIVIGLGIFLYPRLFGKNQAATTGGGGRGGAGREVPVVAQIIKKGQLKVYLDGLGTVTPFNTVTVRTRVDGEIMKIHFTEGQIVKKGDLLIEIDKRPFQAQLVQAQGAHARDAAQLLGAQQDLKRDIEAGTAIAKQQVDQQAALVAQYQGAVQADQGQIDSANVNIKYCDITSPIDGWIGLRQVDQGNIVHASDPNGLVVVNQLQPISVIFSIPQDDIPRVTTQKNGGVGLPVQALNRDKTATIAEGTLLALDSQVDPTTGMIKIKASFENKNNALFPNQFVNIKLLVDTLSDVVIAPNEAIQQGPDNLEFAYVVKDDNTIELRKIKTGATEGSRTVITEGLEPGDKVVTDGVDKLTEGSKVSVKIGRPGSSTRPGASAATQPGATTRKSGQNGGHRKAGAS